MPIDERLTYVVGTVPLPADYYRQGSVWKKQVGAIPFERVVRSDQDQAQQKSEKDVAHRFLLPTNIGRV